MQLDAVTSKGSFVRQDSAFRSMEVEPVAGRYHLYVSLACPWAHRTIIVRMLKGLQDAIGLTVVDPLRDDLGWRFLAPEARYGWEYLSEAYALTDPDWSGRVTVPVLWDEQERRIVNNESADVVVLLNEAFDAVAADPGLDLYPAALRPEIDELNAWVYDTVNNGVYKSGFATTQTAYDEAVTALFASLDRLEERLAQSGDPFLFGAEPTLADWRLFPTLVRFDAVYVGHFKCNLRRIADHEHLSAYLRRLYQWPGVAETVDFDHIKRHYYMTHPSINPSRIVPAGPLQDLGR